MRTLVHPRSCRPRWYVMRLWRLCTLTLNSMIRMRRRLSPSAPSLPPPEDTEHGPTIHEEEVDTQKVGQR